MRWPHREIIIIVHCIFRGMLLLPKVLTFLKFLVKLSFNLILNSKESYFNSTLQFMGDAASAQSAYTREVFEFFVKMSLRKLKFETPFERAYLILNQRCFAAVWMQRETTYIVYSFSLYIYYVVNIIIIMLEKLRHTLKKPT